MTEHDSDRGAADRAARVRNYLPRLLPGSVVFVLLAFEGPDPYSRLGGLATRVTELSTALAGEGYETHLFFIGDPDLPEVEPHAKLPLTYHRCCQWVSARHPGGAYAGEEEKVADFRATVPRAVVEAVARPAVAAGKRIVVLSEEWQTAAAACDLSDHLYFAGLRDRALLLWNANHLYGLERVDTTRLRQTHTVTAVSQWLKHELSHWGLPALVIPNGIPPRFTREDPQAAHVSRLLRGGLDGCPLLLKVARWDPDKRWPTAFASLAGLRRRGISAVMVARGDDGSRRAEGLRTAASLGLRVEEVATPSANPEEMAAALLAALGRAEVVAPQFHLPEPLLRGLYHAADAVLANSAVEPFGLVGLEAMACGGIAFVGATGESYARPFENAVVLETNQSREIEASLIELLENPLEADRLRHAARTTAAHWTWQRALSLLFRRLRYLALIQGWD